MPNQLQYLGEQDLHVAGAVSEPTGVYAHGRAGPVAHLPCSGVDEEAIFSFSLLSHRLQAEAWHWGHEISRVGLAPDLCSAVDLSLMLGVGVSWP